MRPDPDRLPVVLATGQALDRSGELGPLDLAERAARVVLDGPGDLARRIERVSVVNVLSHRAGPAPASELAARLGLAPARAETTAIGGNSPQLLVNRAAAEVASGRLGAALVAGAEAIRATRLAPQADPSPPAAGSDEVVGAERQDLSEGERAAGLLVPVFVYPLFESVLAARAGRTNAEQRSEIGRLLEGFSAVAAGHPYAWFRQPLTAGEIATPSPANRLVAEPYTKRMTAFLGSSQGSALVVTSLGAARALGREDEAVFVWAGADAEEVWYPIARPDLAAAPALGSAFEAVFSAAGVGPDDLNRLDLYSCFPSAVAIAAGELGVALDDRRGLTVTGGLAYFGGPGSNYVGHSIATMCELLRRDGEGIGLVTGVGWYLTKHSVGLYGATPPPLGFSAAEAPPPGPQVPVASGLSEPAHGRVEAATVLYDRGAVPLAAPALVRLPDGSRLAAAVGPEALAEVAEAGALRPLVGLEVEVVPGRPPTYRLGAGVARPILSTAKEGP